MCLEGLTGPYKLPHPLLSHTTSGPPQPFSCPSRHRNILLIHSTQRANGYSLHPPLSLSQAPWSQWLDSSPLLSCPSAPVCPQRVGCLEIRSSRAGEMKQGPLRACISIHDRLLLPQEVTQLLQDSCFPSMGAAHCTAGSTRLLLSTQMTAHTGTVTGLTLDMKQWQEHLPLDCACPMARCGWGWALPV